MRIHQRFHSRTIIGWLLLALLVMAGLTPIAHARLSREALDHALHATVLIYTLDNNLDIVASGSGSIVDERGLILTNFHVVGDTEQETLSNSEGLVAIAITRNPRRPAVPLYFGQVVRGSAALDLAVVSVIADIEGNDLNGCQTLPAYELGDSEQILIGEEIATIGFPGIGGESVTFTTGNVSGFDSEGETTLWIKTDSEINPGNSGGSAVSDDGKLIGVPTAGIVEESSAGKIGLVRPINLAAGLLSNLSSLGVAGCDSQGGKPGGGLPIKGGNEEGSIEFLGFTLQPEDEDLVSEAPSGSEELYGHFSYTDISPNTAFRSQWSLNGRALEETLLEYDQWPLEVGDSTAYVWTKDENGLQDGTYTLEVQIGDLPAISGQIDVGGSTGPATPAPEVFLTGRVISADSGKALADTTFALLTPGITWNTFDSNNRRHVYDVVFTDSRGYFETSLAVSLDTAYSIGVFADGYEPIMVDAFEPLEFYETGNFLDLGDIDLKQE